MMWVIDSTCDMWQELGIEEVRSNDNRLRTQESISPTFYERNCANFLAPIKSFTFTSSTKKLHAKLLYKKAAHKMLVKLTPGSQFELDFEAKILLSENSKKWAANLESRLFPVDSRLGRFRVNVQKCSSTKKRHFHQMTKRVFEKLSWQHDTTSLSHLS